jgi:hypothetical protein
MQRTQRQKIGKTRIYPPDIRWIDADDIRHTNNEIRVLNSE